MTIKEGVTSANHAAKAAALLRDTADSATQSINSLIRSMSNELGELKGRDYKFKVEAISHITGEYRCYMDARDRLIDTLELTAKEVN